VTPEAADYLAKAREFLAKAQDMLASGWPDEAARAAYLAGYHAAEAYIFERTGKTVKTHRGLRSEFGRLARSELRIGREFLTFLVEAYEFKSIADYAIGAAACPISEADAASAIDTATWFVECIAGLLA
jgi:uncharacterized protein (UPF0332 family)